ncbi:MAG: GNAT family N-acetyltransferase [Leptospiraceae bacterium]|nr:GNAT family N-acetyltransferase [Leptospiraceae bacterium]
MVAKYECSAEIVAWDERQADEIARIFLAAVHAIPDRFYSRSERLAWAPAVYSSTHWRQRLQEYQTRVIRFGSAYCAFLSYQPRSDDTEQIPVPGLYIDCLYVDPVWQRQGLGGRLLQYAINQATNGHYHSCFSDVSRAARSLFENFGFQWHHTNQLVRNGVELQNDRMRYRLAQQTQKELDS